MPGAVSVSADRLQIAPRAAGRRRAGPRRRWRGARGAGRSGCCGESPAYSTARAAGSGDDDHPSPGHRDEVVRRQPEHRVADGRPPPRSPRSVSRCSSISVTSGGVPDGRDAADREARVAPGRSRRRPLERLADERAPTCASSTRLAPLVTTSSGAPGLAQAEDERLGDLVHLAAHGARAASAAVRAGLPEVHDLVVERRARAAPPARAATLALSSSATIAVQRVARQSRHLGEVLDVVVGDVRGVLRERHGTEEAGDPQALARRRPAARAGSRCVAARARSKACRSSSKRLGAVVALARPRLRAEGREGRTVLGERCAAAGAGTRSVSTWSRWAMHLVEAPLALPRVGGGAGPRRGRPPTARRRPGGGLERGDQLGTAAAAPAPRSAWAGGRARARTSWICRRCSVSCSSVLRAYVSTVRAPRLGLTPSRCQPASSRPLQDARATWSRAEPKTRDERVARSLASSGGGRRLVEARAASRPACAAGAAGTCRGRPRRGGARPRRSTTRRAAAAAPPARACSRASSRAACRGGGGRSRARSARGPSSR